VKPRARPDARFGVRALVAAAALVLVAVPFALLLFLVQDKWRPLLRADDGARDDLHSVAVAHHGFVTAMNVISTIGGSAVTWSVFIGVTLWLLWRRVPRLAIFVAVAVGGSSLLNQVVKHAVNRARPVLADPVAHANGLSFPSGHAQSAIVAYSTLLLVFWPSLHGAWRWLAAGAAVFMVLAIGFSRIALGVHYLSDVLAGYVLGAAWIAATAAIFNAWRRELGRPHEARLGDDPAT
jgi:membrane-associated phospholipid phosphatase